ncbi:mechanosensitive ion channel family protein [Halorussus sp. MSC15.2]|uniref:mechanosensitive ion channel family protein n=1 Tax=Halorussus sp. MSC15.2 TaxID=2283638 RepID=UPI0013CF4804|nr:mechanosensitive ion channel family protein [Halorussus sp. MSC15.2]NEU57431.1 mechanosensitive ion channel family protein [Halorussus sp. MSC15.2]
MLRSVERLSLLSAVVLALAAGVVAELDFAPLTVSGLPVVDVLTKALLVGAIVTAAYGVYGLTFEAVVERTTSKRRRHDARNVLRLVFVAVTAVAIFGVLTAQWVGVLFSLGVVGFAVTFALQQPLFSLIGWFYIVVKRPYHVGDRVAIEGSKGDVVDVDFFVTTLWEINGELVSSHQPSGRTITLPNSVVLSSHVYNYSWEEFPYVWNELGVQVAYETDLAFTKAVMEREAEALLGEEMRSRIRRYRERLDETPVELEVRDGPTVNVRQEESWVDLRLRYLVHPKRGTQVRNELYDRILSSLNDHPDRVDFPVSRNR